ncbi:MAG: CheR family methyltransferase [Ilumatobacteraceae bacterium]
MTVSDHVVERAAAVLHRHIGLRLEPSLRSRLARAIADAAEVVGQDPEAYVDAMAGDEHARQGLFDRVTVQETGFFRHPAHFEVLAHHVLPGLTGPVRIWSAACSNGQEPYSLAMVLAETGVAGRVLATDLSTAAVRRTLEGRYAARELHGLSPARQALHGVTGGAGWEVSSAIRQRVSVEARNLLDPPPSDIATCQIVFVRNVLIYFTPEHATAFVERLADFLPRGAHVFLGGAESMWHLTDRFEPIHVGGTFIYRLRDATPIELPRSRSSVPARPARRVERRRSPSPPAAPSRAPAVSAPPITAEALAHRGLEAFASGEHLAAIHAFRQWAYIDPDDPIAHFHLGIALEEADQGSAADRAYDRSRSLILSGPGSAAVTAFGGYGVEDVVRLLDAKRERRR